MRKSSLRPVRARAHRRARAGKANPDLLLLTFGSIRPYKGVDIALDALARVDPSLRVRLVVAGRSWGGGDELRAHAEGLGLDGRVEFRDRFIPNEEAALLFGAADASLLPYRSASQSGVVQLSFAYGRPVIATWVGGLPAAVEDGVDGILCEPDAAALAVAIERMARDHADLAEGVRVHESARSFRRYGELLDEAVSELSAMKKRGIGENSALALAGDVASKAGALVVVVVAARLLSVPEFAVLDDRARGRRFACVSARPRRGNAADARRRAERGIAGLLSSSPCSKRARLLPPHFSSRRRSSGSLLGRPSRHSRSRRSASLARSRCPSWGCYRSCQDIRPEAHAATRGRGPLGHRRRSRIRFSCHAPTRCFWSRAVARL